jgi:hypothetical protein
MLIWRYLKECLGPTILFNLYIITLVFLSTAIVFIIRKEPEIVQNIIMVAKSWTDFVARLDDKCT